MTYSYKASFELSGKTAIVTGALGIIGSKVCTGLAEFGANIVAVDLNEEAANDFAGKLALNFGVQAVGIGCNVADPDDVAIMVERAVNIMGGVHILHNNAGYKPLVREQYLAPFEEYTLEQWREVMSVNIDGVFLVAKEVGKQMVEQGVGGTIIQTASIYGIMAPDHRIYEGSSYLDKPMASPAVYSASKGGVVALTKYLAAYWSKQGIRVNTITPGGVESGQNEEFKRNYSARIPLGRMAEADEMVGAVLYLASDASSYVTGQNIIVDGGLDAW
ncbi:SDR family oxidoreductase [Paenibacillus sp. CF384]|uniref:SDR family oxidoreductase n=1 Tax=Paenibacillus sp. CF384 TaxID=1884382 RepID=UPI0008959930|nr:SDR family oxidoreductase [Paenibacillus sp. CF384]SDX28796.1 NAD(P)-dependent dehydrogenase, short-chain alcohol dehydrogenase family [Paenibacillus sp. CF384]